MKLIRASRHFNKAKLYYQIYHELLMWFWPGNEMIELVSGMPAPQFADESSLVQGSDLVLGSSGSCV
jgi:hypothetical protein